MSGGLMHYKINWEMNEVLTQFFGILNVKVNNNVTIEILNAPRLENFKYIIWDLSVSGQNMTKNEENLATWNYYLMK